MKPAFTVAKAARHNQRLAKVVAVADGRIVGVKPAPQAGEHVFVHFEADGLDPFMDAVQEVARIGGIIVRGAPKAERGRRAIYDHPDKGAAGLVTIPRTWCAFDFDGVLIRSHQPDPADLELADDQAEAFRWAKPDPLLDPEIGVRQCLRVLPRQFRDRSCGWQVTASASYKPGWRLRTWHVLDTPCIGKQLKTWLRPAIERNLLDPSTLVETQPHYVAVSFIGGPDPCPRRFGILRQPGGDVVEIPDLDAIARRVAEMERREREKDRRRATSRTRVATSFYRPLTGTRASLERRLGDCIDRVAAAQQGQRHPTYLHECARAKAICDKYDVPWAGWRDALQEAYEGTLTASEASERQRGSTEGVPEWFDRRGA
jgi:hypothetical protein